MNYNIVVIISLVICAIISLMFSYYGTLIMLDESNGLFKIVQLLIAVMTMFTLYTPLKFKLLEYMDVKIDESEK